MYNHIKNKTLFYIVTYIFIFLFNSNYIQKLELRGNVKNINVKF